MDLPKFTLVILGESETLNEGDPVFDGDTNKLTKIGVHDVFKAVDDTLERGCLVVGAISLKEVVALTKLILDLTNEEVTPLNEHVLGHRLVVRVLDFAQVSQLSWELKNRFIGV